MPQLTAFFGLEGSGRAERAARSGLPLARTREEALRLLRAGISCALDAPDPHSRREAPPGGENGRAMRPKEGTLFP